MQAQKPTAVRGRKSTAKPAQTPAPAVMASTAQDMPDERRQQAICQAAYALYEQRGCVYGHALEDWLAAEAQVGQALAAQPSGAAGGQTGH